jgi:hypothetical protein
MLRAMSNTSIKEVDRAGLVDIKTVAIDAEQDVCIRMQDYLRQIKNPYCFLVGNTPVKIAFQESGKPLDDAILHYFLSLKQ